MSSTDEKLFSLRHSVLLKYQNDKVPTVKIREVQEVLGVASTNTAQHFLNRLVKLGFAEKIPTGDVKSEYHIIKGV